MIDWICDPRILTSIGLGLDILGILVLFKFQIDFNKDIHSGTVRAGLMVEESFDKNMARVFKKYVRLTKAGQLLIVAGFSLQLAALWLV